MSAELPGRALVVGMGLSGEAAAGALRERGAEVVTADREDGTDDELALLDGVDVLVKSPGVPAENPLVVEARSRGIPVWSEVELGYRLLPEGVRLVGVTGTKGKTTTVALLGAILEAAGRPVALAGNVQPPLSEVAGSVEPGTWLVCELSSFQLEDVHDLALRRSPCCSTSSRTISTATAPSRRTATRSCESSSAPSDRRRPARQRPGRESSSERRRPAAGRAADPRRAQPRERRRRDAPRRASWASPRRRSPGRSCRFPVSSTGSSRSREIGGVRYVNDSKATNVGAARARAGRLCGRAACA